jgi:glycosyltransferase involved in cell wall biosynthesis
MAVRILFDTTRLAWRARRGSPTGIDRVLLAYAERLPRMPGFEVRPVALVGDRLVPVSRRGLARVIDRMRAAEARRAPRVWDDLAAALSPGAGAGEVLRRPMEATAFSDRLALGLEVAARAVGGAASPRPGGDVYLNVAHTGLHHPRLFTALRRAGVSPAVMVHDLIPVTHPEYCTPRAGTRHVQRMDNVIDHASLVIANSQGTADALSRYAQATGRTAPPVEVAPLGVADAFTRPVAEGGARLPYFVCVGTIEARKNLAFLLAVWRRLAESMGTGAPHLVLVGRRGWENEAVVDHLERAPPLKSLVHEVADLTDDQLASLMAGARALLAPSFAEGFDLPVAEARAVGTPVIASDIDVHRELAAGARLVDPLDGPGWIAAIRDALVDGGRPRPLPAPTWDQHFARVEPRLLDLARQGGPRS